jgi:hypothetical protein
MKILPMQEVFGVLPLPMRDRWLYTQLTIPEAKCAGS